MKPAERDGLSVPDPEESAAIDGRMATALAKGPIESQFVSTEFDDELDLVNHPPHYTSHPSGIECIQITEHMGFNIGNAIKYLWRADEKGAPLDDLRKAAWYVQREIERRERAV